MGLFTRNTNTNLSCCAVCSRSQLESRIHRRYYTTITKNTDGSHTTTRHYVNLCNTHIGTPANDVHRARQKYFAKTNRHLTLREKLQELAKRYPHIKHQANVRIILMSE